MVKVIATAQGYDGIAVREVGQEFEMPDDVFDERNKLDKDGEPIEGQFYEPPNWFEPVDAGLRAKIEAQRKNARRAHRVPAVDPSKQRAAQDAEAKRIAAEQEAARDAALAKARQEEEDEKRKKALDKDKQHNK